MRNRSQKLPAVYADTTAGWHHGPPREGWPLEVHEVTWLHFHSTLEFGVCVSGRGVCYIEGVAQPFAQGDVQVIFPYQRHLSKSVGPVSSQWRWLNVDPLRVLPEWSLAEKLISAEMALCGILPQGQYPRLAELITALLCLNDGAETAPHREELLKTLLQLILLTLCDASRDLPKLLLPRNPRLEALSGALEAVQQGRSPSVPALARACGMSVATLRRVFVATVGQSPQAYVAACRMRRAQTLLYATNDRVTDIAQSLGYEDVSGFNRAFLTYCGMSPTAYRRAGAAAE